MTYFCHCKDCMKMKRKGKILGSRVMGFWINNGSGYEYNLGSVSGYVPFPKFSKGNRVRRPNNNTIEFE